MKYATGRKHQIIYKDTFSYCAHPHIGRLRDGSWLLVFNRTVRRPFILHPPEDPHYYNVTMHTADLGCTWSSPRVAPGYDWYGVECAGLTSLSDGTVLLNQWRFRWLPLETARKLANTSAFTFPEVWIESMKKEAEINRDSGLPDDVVERVPWARGNGGTYVHRSVDLGQTWQETVEIDTRPYSGGYSMRGAVELDNGDVLLPLSDVPNYQTIFIVRSGDGGRSWGNLVQVAQATDLWFEEPTALLLRDGRILMLLRENKTHSLYQTNSDDGGWTWSTPTRTEIWGYPGDLLALPDGRILCVYGYRAVPYGIRAAVSVDNGQSWDVDHLLVIRDDLPNRDLGYPASVLVDDRWIYTVYYGQDVDGVTCIQASTYQIPE